jgi:LmbE family N-acetylglucosaminyl deacetylase
MALLALAIPLAPGKTDQWKKFTDELRGARRAEFVASRKRLGVRERTFLQRTPHGDMVIVTLEGENPAKAFAEFGQGTDAFTTWFKQQVSELHGGMDLSAPPPGPMPELIVDSQG